jgi:hypothetical protein
MARLDIHDGIRMYTVIVNADTNRVSSFYNQAVVGFFLTLSWHAPPTPKRRSCKATKREKRDRTSDLGMQSAPDSECDPYTRRCLR